MRVDFQRVAEALEHHLREDGVTVSRRGRELRLDDGLVLRLRTEPGTDADGPAALFWVDVEGLRYQPPPSFDLSGWGVAEEDVLTDAVHGLLGSIVPPLRWLAADPWREPTPDLGTAIRLEGEDGRPWTAVVGRPWVIIAAVAEGQDVDALGEAMRLSLHAATPRLFEVFGGWGRKLTAVDRGHWIKTYASRMPDGTLDSRIDIDNEFSLTSPPFQGWVPWRDGELIQLVRQLIVMRPDHETSRAAPKGRLARLFGR